MKPITLFLLMTLVFFPMEVYAKEPTPSYFSVNLDIGTHQWIAPNDAFTEVFTIENHSSDSIKVRVSEVSNIENSRLYPVLQAGWVDENGSANLGTLDKLTTDWFLIESGKSLDLKLNLYFPDSLGNEYQATTLNAQFTFECRAPQNKQYQISSTNEQKSHITVTIPNTSDHAPMDSMLMLSIISASIAILLFLSRKPRGQKRV